MTRSVELPPGVREGDRIVLFDGVCRLCNGWARFLIRFDRDRRFKLASVQSPEGAAILEWFGFPTDTYETMLLVEGPRMYQRSAAFIRVVARLPFPWRLAAVVWLIPSPIRDWLYDRVALNRYRVFGRFESCVLPTADHLERYLDAD
jgi:predicted DCC family thiol-disulfide oxidoreductase YuxK